MKNITLLWSNIRKQKGSYIGILTLMFIITVTLSSVLAIWKNSATYVESEMKRVHFGDIVYWVYDKDEAIDEILKKMSRVEGVEKVKTEKMVMVKAKISGKDSRSNVFAKEYDPSHYPYKIFDGTKAKYVKEPSKLVEGEIYAPISFQSIYGTKLGDTFEIRGLLEGEKRSYKIKGFYEDPCEGSSLMGIKDILMNSEDFTYLRKSISSLQEKGVKTEHSSGQILHVYEEGGASIPSAKELQMKINKETKIQNYAYNTYTRFAISSFMLSIQNIFIGVLIGFVFVLLLVAVIIIGHSISSTIEQTYVDLGILKAVGFTNRSLCAVQCLQYFTILGVGLILGLACATPLVRSINQLIIPVTGIIIPSTIPLKLATIAFGTVLLFLLLFVVFKVQKIGNIKPIVAIRGGREEVFFTNRFQPKIYAKGLQFFMAVRQIFAVKKQYIGILVITMLMVFFLSICGKASNWLGPNGEGLKNSMGVASVEGKTYDFAIYYKENVKEQVEELIKEKTKIKETYDAITVSAQLNHADYIMNVISKPQYIHMIEGHYCKYDDEIVITSMVARELKLKIGDRVDVSAGGDNKSYIISGINECANDMGSNFTISEAGYKRIATVDSSMYTSYVLEDSSQKAELIKAINHKYKSKIIMDKNDWSGIDGIVGATKALTILMYAICIIFIFVVVFMTGGKVLYREQHDLGVYKALGFLSSKLRISFALRFALVAVVGATLGCILGNVLTDPIMSMAFKLMGVENFSTTVTLSGILMPIGLVVGIFFLAAFLLAARIKKTSPSILIVE